MFWKTAHAACGRKYTEQVKRVYCMFYLRTVIPFPPSFNDKDPWASSVNCEPGFIKEAFEILHKEVEGPREKKTAVFYSMQWQSGSKLCVTMYQMCIGFVDYGGAHTTVVCVQTDFVYPQQKK